MSVNRHPDRPTDDTSRRIILAAIAIISRVGYTKATTREIAEAAGVNEVTLFRHFGSKINLLMASVEAFNANTFASTFETDLTGDYRQDIRRMAMMQIADTTSHLEMLRLLICDARNVPELREAILAGGSANLARLSGYFQRQMDMGVVRADIPAEVLASAFDSLFSAPVLFESLFEGSLSSRLPAEAMVQPLIDLFVRGSLAGVE
jgi:AcrR family transcriptional regulator